MIYLYGTETQGINSFCHVLYATLDMATELVYCGPNGYWGPNSELVDVRKEMAMVRVRGEAKGQEVEDMQTERRKAKREKIRHIYKSYAFKVPFSVVLLI